MHIAIDGNNFFHTGWLACFLGLPREHPSHLALRDSDNRGFEEGWDTCCETGPAAWKALNPMIRNGQCSVFWSNEGD